MIITYLRSEYGTKHKLTSKIRFFTYR